MIDQLDRTIIILNPEKFWIGLGQSNISGPASGGKKGKNEAQKSEKAKNDSVISGSENKDNSETAAFKIERNDEIFAEVSKQAKLMQILSNHKNTNGEVDPLLPPPRPDEKSNYECTNCAELLKPLQKDCCVFCSYGTVPCPPIQLQNNSCCG